MFVDSVISAVVRQFERRADRKYIEEKEAEKAEQAKLQAREDAISRVVEEYLRNARRHYDTHITGLIRAEITELESDEEVRKAIAIIERREPGHPIPKQERDNLLSPDVNVLCAFRKWRKIGYGKPNPPKKFREVVEMCRTQQ